MDIKNLVRLAVVLTAVSVTTAIVCQDPTPYVGKWVIGVDNKECVALVKEKCGGLKVVTEQWKRGLKVRSNCGKIPRWTAIATFLAAGGIYEGHAAIFESCAADGIWVYDQWNTAPVERRKISYNGNKPNYNGNYFYTIEI